MKKLMIATIAVSVAVLSSLTARAADTTSSAAAASIVAALSISNTGGLNFGQIAPSIAIGTVTVPTTGTRTKTGGVTLGNQVTATASSFTVTGEGANTYAITLPSSVSITGPGAPMVVDGFVSTPGPIGTLTLGTQTLLVGATLNVGVSQVAGAYTGTFDVTVAYN